MPYKKGETGNPGGRRKAAATFEVRQLAQQYTAEAIARLADWMRSDEPKASVQACMALLERGWGKAVGPDEQEILKAKLELLRQGHNPDAAQITVVVPDFGKPEPTE